MGEGFFRRTRDWLAVLSEATHVAWTAWKHPVDLSVTTGRDAALPVGLLDRLAVRSDVASWCMPPPFPIGIAFGTAFGGMPVAAATGSVLLAKVLVSPLVMLVFWLVPLIVRRVWCEMHPYVPARWFAAAQVTFGQDLIAAALDSLRDRACADPDRVIRRSELIEAITDQRHRMADACQAAAGVRLGDDGTSLSRRPR